VAAPPKVSMTSDDAAGSVRFRRGLLWSAGLLAVMAALVLQRAPLLSGAAKAWMVNARLAKSDAIVVLGGDPNSRAFEAAQLYRAGWAPVVLVMSPKLQATDQLGITMTQAELTRRILLTNAVPASAIQIRGTNLESTFAEALATREWLKESGATSLLIPTGPFHSRRVQWVFHKTMGNSVRLTVRSIHPELCQQWWRNESSFIDFENEITKFAYYLVKY
jgi:uncharacterized SAM-binding protein YcdF (DUF218 family)